MVSTPHPSSLARGEGLVYVVSNYLVGDRVMGIVPQNPLHTKNGFLMPVPVFIEQPQVVIKVVIPSLRPADGLSEEQLSFIGPSVISAKNTHIQ